MGCRYCSRRGPALGPLAQPGSGEGPPRSADRSSGPGGPFASTCGKWEALLCSREMHAHGSATESTGLPPPPSPGKGGSAHRVGHSRTDLAARVGEVATAVRCGSRPPYGGLRPSLLHRRREGRGPTAGTAQHGPRRQAEFSMLWNAGAHTPRVKTTQTCHPTSPAEQEPNLCGWALRWGSHRLGSVKAWPRSRSET